MSCKRGRFMRHAFHQIAVAGDEIRVMVDDLMIRPIEERAEQRFTNCHPDRIAESLTQWASGRLDTGRVAVLRMSRSLALPLTELLDVVQGQVIAREIEHGVKQHRRVTCRKNKA